MDDLIPDEPLEGEEDGFDLEGQRGGGGGGGGGGTNTTASPALVGRQSRSKQSSTGVKSGGGLGGDGAVAVVKRWYTDGKPSQEERLRAAAADESLTFERYLGLMTSVLRPVEEGGHAEGAGVASAEASPGPPAASPVQLVQSEIDGGGAADASVPNSPTVQWAEEELVHVEADVERAYRKEFEAMDVDGDGIVTVKELLTHLSGSPERPGANSGELESSHAEARAQTPGDGAETDGMVDDNDISLHLESSSNFPQL
jgi:hypothetical protein